jgi:mannan endo-1,4-beta-mannosidase
MITIKAIKRREMFAGVFGCLLVSSILSLCDAQPIGGTIALHSKATNNYVAAWDEGVSIDLHASALHADARSEIEVVNAGNGYVAIRSIKTDKFWTVNGTGPDVKLLCSASGVTEAGLFLWNDNGDGTVALKSKANNAYVSVVEEDTTIVPSYDPALIAKYSSLNKSAADNDGTSSLVITPEMLKPYVVKFYLLRARAMTLGDQEKFEVTQPSLNKQLATTRPSKVLTFMYSISGKKTITGIHNREPNSNPTQFTNMIYNDAGVYPALWGGDFLFESDNVASRGTMINEAKNEWSKGAVVNLMYHMCPPMQGESCSWTGGVQSSLSNDQWTQLTTDGTALNTTFKQRLRSIGTWFQSLKDAGVEVIYRPFHEMNQGAFWWGGRTGATGTSRLFQIEHDYLVDTLGLTNIFFIWSVQDLGWNFQDYNPGDAYWDIFTLDFYNGDGFTTQKYNAMLDVAGTKLIGIAECTTVPTAAQLLTQPRWVYFSGWSELTTGDIKGTYTAANTLSRDEMPGWGNVIATTGVSRNHAAGDPGLLRVDLVSGLVRFTMPENGPAMITVHNAKGQLLSTVAEGDFSAGPHTANIAFRTLSAGIYFVKLAAKNQELFVKFSSVN